MLDTQLNHVNHNHMRTSRPRAERSHGERPV